MKESEGYSIRMRAWIHHTKCEKILAVLCSVPTLVFASSADDAP
jgi:hypothetical protein